MLAARARAQAQDSPRKVAKLLQFQVGRKRRKVINKEETGGFKGGGFKGGHVHGATDPEGVKEEPKDRVKVADIHATVLHQFGIDHKREYENLRFERFGTLSEGEVKPSLIKST